MGGAGNERKKGKINKELTDEEIDEDGAFDSDHELKYGEILNVIQQRNELDSEEEDPEDKFSDEEDLEDESSDEEEIESEEDEGDLPLGEGRERLVKFVEDLNVKSSANGNSRALDINSSLLDVNKDKLNVQDLLLGLEDETNFGSLKSQFFKLKKRVNNKNDLVAPKPSRIVRERLERQAAYQETKKEISKWTQVVKCNREAESLSFPLNQPPQNDAGNCNTLADMHKPDNEFEKAINQALLEAKLGQDSIVEAEVESIKKMSPEEMEARTAELRHARSIVYYRYQKLKRISKIKSRIYRKFHRNNENNVQKSNGDKAYEFAKERMTLKHKKMSSWRQQISGRNLGTARKEVQNSLLEQNKLHNELVAKDDDSSDDSSYDEGTLDDLKEDLLDIKNGEHEVPKSSLFNMKFMQRGLEREKEEINSEVDDVIKEIDGHAENPNVKEDKNEEVSDTGRRKIKKNPDDNVSVTEENSWLTEGGSVSKKKRLNIQKPSSQESKFSNMVALSRRVEKQEEVSNKARNIRVNLNPIENLAEYLQRVPVENLCAESQTKSNPDDDTEKDGDTSKHPNFRHLMSKIFSNDDAEKEFRKEKKAKIEEDAPKSGEVPLLGWNSWAGPGIKSKCFKIPNTTKSSIEGRKDGKLKNVIISEKRNKKYLDKYSIKQVPYGFGNKESYERLIKTPIGKDWHAITIHKKIVRPRITVKRGSVINPISMGPSMLNKSLKDMNFRSTKHGVEIPIVTNTK